ncbi:MAG: thiamine pyrophosphate-dependent dehydrogenase E1 component subunit alpha [Coriobacteriales bacterium]|jgi:pyruvate dehydrogenase E1 component alpha subunit|nr:thiamine pyrophosphate-dependent dehydrogenase E1 component subunit alpha [Coriobacteriales bacterium]
MKIDKEQIQDMYLRMRKIREFESKAQSLFAEGKIPGFVHLYLGEEAAAAGVCACLDDEDFITSTHRGHGHIIAKGGDLKYMMAELYGRETGYCKGKGGSMHIADRERGILGANGIVGAGHNIAVGAGLTCSYLNNGKVVVCFFGDASTNQGTFHESLNLASIWKLPVVFVCENNYYGISMSQGRHMSIKDIADRASAYGIPGIAVDGNDVLAVYEAASEAVARARKGHGPTLIECKTYRQRGHFEGDPGTYKPAKEQEEWLKKDPLPRLVNIMKETGFTDDEIAAIDNSVAAELAAAITFAEESPSPKVESTVEDVYSDIVEEVRVR